METDPTPSVETSIDVTRKGDLTPLRVNTEPTSILRWIPWILTLPFNLLVGWPFVLIFGHRYRWRATGWFSATWRPGIQTVLDRIAKLFNPRDPNTRRGWHYSMTLGHGTCFDPTHLESPDGGEPETVGHEREHTWQAEDLATLMFFVAILILSVGGLKLWPLAAGVWVASYAWLSVGFLVAVLRGWRVYRDAWHERAAYALAERNGQFTEGLRTEREVQARERSMSRVKVT